MLALVLLPYFSLLVSPVLAVFAHPWLATALAAGSLAVLLTVAFWGARRG